MFGEEEKGSNKEITYEDGGIVINVGTRLSEIEREQAEAKGRDQQYKNDQIAISRKMAWFTLALVLCTVGTGLIAIWQARIANKSADAAQSAAHTASDSLTEIKKSSSDTHALAVAAGKQADAAGKQADAAKAQADRTKDIADRTLAQAQATNRLATAANTSAEAGTATATIAAKQLELAQRPWVDARIEVDGPFEFNVNGANVHLKITLTNSGHSPAQSVFLSPVLLIGYKGFSAGTFREQVCKDATRVSTTMPQFGMTLFPNVNFPQYMSFGVGKEDIENQKLSKEFPGSKFPNAFDNPTVLVCIAYSPSFDKAVVYHTSYILDLYKRDSAGQLGTMFIIGENVDINHLTLRLHIADAIHAD